ncbi:IclR family transcriptional regulator [Saccharopolyspora sp. ASAGF58]|uniref:IclR family transcriptional regulator n=1 Tax=Saccharopolyspora sp. ASAGF58 TaxID=2719023 RepID=UPI00144009B0|nr:IclR family transcriptional regulator [Saccharopolyspora sp. ASAGF58]QIZ38843.1 IclR family transcriptional regulator [Saccharopolyspora sp. ASAGF58]
MPDQSGSPSSFARGLDVLAAVVDGGPQRVEEISRRTGLPTSSVYRFLRTLVAAGFLEPDDGVYRVGARLARSGEGGNERLRELALPLLRRLVEQTSETALLTVRVGRSALVVESVDSPHSMRVSFTRGHLRPLHAGASAKALLAFAPAEVADEVLKHGMERFTPNTPTKSALCRQLETIRQQRYVISHGEVDQHAVAIGVPVMRGGELVCAFSVAGPEHRLDGSRARAELRALQAAAAQLEAALDDPGKPSALPGA